MAHTERSKCLNAKPDPKEELKSERAGRGVFVRPEGQGDTHRGIEVVLVRGA